MTEGLKIDTVRSYSSGTVGRALNSARTNHFILDSPSGPNEALTNGEAFLSGISSCGVTLIEGYAKQNGVPLKNMQVTIEGIPEPRGAEQLSGHQHALRDRGCGPGSSGGARRDLQGPLTALPHGRGGDQGQRRSRSEAVAGRR